MLSKFFIDEVETMSKKDRDALRELLGKMDVGVETETEQPESEPEKTVLISELLKDKAEPVYDNFVPRREFINRTGVYISPSHYSTVYEHFKEFGVSVDDFLKDYEDKYSVCIIEASLPAPFKYEITDTDVSGDDVFCDDETHETNVWEIVDLFAVKYHKKHVYADEKIAELTGMVKEIASKTLAELAKMATDLENMQAITEGLERKVELQTTLKDITDKA